MSDEYGKIIDYSEEFPEAMLAQGRDTNVLILRKLDEPYERPDRKKAQYEIEYRWLSQECKDSSDEAFVCVQGSEFTYWQKKELSSFFKKFDAEEEVSIFDHVNLF